MKKTSTLFAILFVLVFALWVIVAFRITATEPEKIEGQAENGIRPPVVEMPERLYPPQEIVYQQDKPISGFSVKKGEACEKAAEIAQNRFEISEYKISSEDTKPDTREKNEESEETKLTYAGEYFATGYDICISCCGKTDGITASGAVATVGRTCASNEFPFGTVLFIEGIGERVVEDRGGMSSGVIDVLCEDHPACYAITGTYNVYVVERGESNGA